MLESLQQLVSGTIDNASVKTAMGIAKAVRVSGLTPDVAVGALKFIGITQPADVEHFVNLAKEVAASDEETLWEFISNGGLRRMFAARRTGERQPLAVVQCHHCGEFTCLE